jgi:hypothetical protein
VRVERHDALLRPDGKTRRALGNNTTLYPAGSVWESHDWDNAPLKDEENAGGLHSMGWGDLPETGPVHGMVRAFAVRAT